ncbi:MAG: hypothetical protein ABI626_05995 [Sphingomicrobium sp.]
MADPTLNKTPNNETMQREQAKASVAGTDRKPEDSRIDSERKPEQAGTDKDRQEKSAIGGADHKADKSPAAQSPTGQSSQNREFDKSRSEPASR